MAAEAAISSAVDLLSDLLIQKVKSIRGVKGKVQSLKQELEWMQSFLKEANKKQAEDERVREWINKIREVAQDAEDTIEMFLINVEDAKENRGLLKRCTGFAKRMHHLDRIGDEIESIRARLHAIDKSRERYGIKDLDEVEKSAWRLQVESRRRLSFWQKDDQVVGVEDYVNNLLRESILNEEKKGLSIAVVEGMGGIGKSTLARTIYNHRDVATDRFDCRGWVVVSSEFSPQETIKQIMFQLQRSEEDRKRITEEIKRLEESMKDKLYIHEELKQMLHKQLEGQSYFIVLDDVWEEEDLESLITAFPNQQEKRSRLLVTTRNKIITKYDPHVHKMKALDPEKSWELFLNKAFIGSTKCPEELVNIGRQILEKCCGLPLAISVVGGLLVGSQSKTAWEQVLNQINSYLGRAESSVSAILELSYQNLSPQLKSCFLCLAFFEEDATIPSKWLEDIWAAQGLIQVEGSGRIDEIANGYLNELINRSMVLIEDLTFDDRVETCRLHDLVREVCLRKAKEEIGLEIVKANSSESSSSKSRHLVVYGRKLETSLSSQNKHLRSLFIHNVNDDSSYFMTTPPRYWKSFQLLKILNLNGFSFLRLPDSFRLLIGLKCLRIQAFRDTSGQELELPIWLDQLKKLEVVCLKNLYVNFPNAALRMERLRCLHVDLVIGRRMKIENWKNIETLKWIFLDHWMECSSRLMAGCQLRELGICLNGNEGGNEASRARASLEKMTNLVELRLLDIWLPVDEIIPQLQSLTILELRCWAIGSLRCPAATAFPPNLSQLMLSGLDEDPMQELGKLPKLQYLTLSESILSLVDSRIKVLHDGFPCLKALSLQCLSNLTGIDIEDGGMPHLNILQIHKCPNLDTQNLPKRIIISPA